MDKPLVKHFHTQPFNLCISYTTLHISKTASKRQTKRYGQAMNDITLPLTPQHCYQSQNKLYQSYFIWMLLTLIMVPVSTSISSIFYVILCLTSLYHITVQDKWRALLSHPFTRYFWSGALLVLIGIFNSTSSWGIALSTAQKYLWLLTTPLLLISIDGNHVLKQKNLSYFLYLTIIVATLVLSFYRIYTLPDYFSPNSNLQLNTIFKDHIIQSLMFIIGLHFCLYQLCREKNRPRQVSYAGLTIALVINLLFINDGRIGYLLLLFTGIYFIFSHLPLKKAVALTVLSVLGLSFTMMFSPILKHRVNNVIEYYQWYQKDPTRYSSLSVRMNNWKIGYALFKEHPLLGHGTGGIYQSQKNYYIKNKIKFEDMLSNSASFFHKRQVNCGKADKSTHLCGDKLLDSSYLNFALQYGVLGIAFCIYFLVGLWRYSHQLSPLDRYMAKIILLCFIIGIWLNPWLSSSAPTHLVSLLFAFIYAKPKRSDEAA